MEEASFDLNDFSLEMGEYEVKQVKEFDRIMRISTGGSIDQHPLIHNGKVYFGSYNHNMHCVDAATGRLVWKYKTKDRIGICSPDVYDGMIFIGSHDHNLYAFDADTGELIWKFRTENAIISGVSVRDGIVYFGSLDKNFYAVSANDGSLVWKYKTHDKILADPIFFENTVIFGSYDKNFYCMDSVSGRFIWKIRTEQNITNSGGFAIKDGFIYLTSLDNLLRKADARTGQIIWKKKISQYGMTCGTVIHNDILIVPTEDGNVFGFDLDGKALWKFSTTKPTGQPTIYNDKIYFTCEDQNLYCIDMNGIVLWKFRTREINWWQPAIWEGKVYFGSYDCNFYALDTESGEIIWKFRADGSPSNYPPAYEGFEVEVKFEDTEIENETPVKRYDFKLEDEIGTSSYKSEITYQMNSTYMKKGKYQVDSSREEF